MAELRRTDGTRSCLLMNEHLIGRGPQCALRLGAPYVSTQHALIRWAGSWWEVLDRGNLTGFVPRGSSVPSFHFVGVQVAEAQAFESVLPDALSEVRTLYPALNLARPGSVRVYATAADFLDIGTPADYLSTALAIAERDRRSSHGARAKIGASARIQQSVLWDDVVVEEGAMLKQCVVADGVVVPADTSWHGVTLRIPHGELAPGERVIEGMAVCPL